MIHDCDAPGCDHDHPPTGATTAPTTPVVLNLTDHAVFRRWDMARRMASVAAAMAAMPPAAAVEPPPPRKFRATYEVSTKTRARRKGLPRRRP